MKLHTSNSHPTSLPKSEYNNGLKFLDRNAGFTEYCSLRARFIWVVNTRPDIFAAISILSTVTKSSQH